MPGPVYVSGERVDLRSTEREDVDLLHYGRNHHELRNVLVETQPRTRGEMESFYDGIVEDDDAAHFVVCESGDDDPIGEANLFYVEHDRGEIACWIHPDAQGQGYGTEALSLLVEYAFETRGLHRVHGKTVDFNDDVHAVMDRLGFTEEGRLRDHLFLDGAYRDVVRYGLLREEWSGSDR
jgi:RimJ/RimL family protein N-acetyltransferase